MPIGARATHRQLARCPWSGRGSRPLCHHKLETPMRLPATNALHNSSPLPGLHTLSVPSSVTAGHRPSSAHRLSALHRRTHARLCPTLWSYIWCSLVQQSFPGPVDGLPERGIGLRLSRPAPLVVSTSGVAASAVFFPPPRYPATAACLGHQHRTMKGPLQRLVRSPGCPRRCLSLPHLLALHAYVVNLLLHTGSQLRGS